MYRLGIILILTVSMYACSEKIFTAGIDCEECYQEKPDSAYVEIKLTVNDTYDSIPLIVYSDKVENYEIDWIDTAYANPFYLFVAVNKYYSVAAKYIKNTDTIIAIDGTKIKIKHVSGECDEECWVIEGDELNVTLKYQ
ncbi:MAG: hypothetical protein JSV22_01740 [Bacteroidales bacterium]|nr:MAG: hypothetical protein JSV22_01740 [Bacteroidales bacterium]